jgi:hypothetical protein
MIGAGLIAIPSQRRGSIGKSQYIHSPVSRAISKTGGIWGKRNAAEAMLGGRDFVVEGFAVDGCAGSVARGTLPIASLVDVSWLVVLY